MSPRFIHRLSSWLALSVVLGLGTGASAATLTWDANTGTAGAQDGGSLNWTNGGNANWLDAGGNNVQWNSATPDSAIFGAASGAAGTVTISTAGGVTVGGLTFNLPGSGAYILAGSGVNGTINLANGALITNNVTPSLTTLSAPLATTGTVTITGTRLWMNNSSFSGGGTLNINTSNGLLFENSGSLNGLAVINLNTGGIDIRTNTGGISSYDYAGGTTLNVTNSLSLTTNAPPSVKWLGNIVVTSGKTLTLGAVTASTALTVSGNISDTGGAAGVTINGHAAATTILSGTNTYSGTTTVNAGTLQIMNGAAIADTGLVSLGTGLANTFDVQASETIGALSGGNTSFGIVNLAAGKTLTLSSGTQNYSGSFTGTGTLAVNGATQTIVNAVTLGAVSVNSGKLTLQAANNITSGLALSGGTVLLQNATAAGSGAIAASGGTIQGAVARGSVLTIANAITVSAGSTVVLSPQVNGGSTGTAATNFGGPLTINSGGVLQLGAPGANAAYGTANGPVGFAANAAAGTKFQLNGNSFTVAGLSTDSTTPGSPVVENGSATTATLTVALAASGASTFAGTLQNGTGAGALNLAVNGGTGSNLTLAGINTFTGSTAVTNGNLTLAHSLALQKSTVTTGGTGLVFDASVASHAFTIGGLSGSTGLALQDNAGSPAAVTLTVGNNGSNQTYSGSLSGPGGLTKAGSGTQTLTGFSTYSGDTTVNAGTLSLSFVAGNTDNIIGASSKLVMGGGTFLTVQSGTGNNQTVNGLTLNSGASVINQTRTGGGNLLLTVGGIVRNVGSTVNFSGNGAGSSQGFATTATNTASGILGGYATFVTGNGSATNTNGTDWATVSSGKIIALAAGSYTNTSATTAATNLNLTASVTLNANVTTGSVRFNSAIASPTLTLNGANTVGSGGILVTSTVGANASLITGGTSLTSGNGQDLIVIQNNTDPLGALTIASKITGAGIGLTKSGAGTLILTGTNDYTGVTTVNTGTLLVRGSISGSETTVNNAATFGGDGGTTGGVTVNSGGTLSPGAGLGTLHTGAVNFNSGSTFKLEIDTTALTTDLLAADGAFTLAGANVNDTILNITDLAAGAATGPLVFATYAGNLATWTGGLFTYNSAVIADDSVLMVGSREFVLDYNYQGNSIALLVPEPGAAMTLLGGVSLLLGIQRFRRRAAGWSDGQG